MSRVEADHRLQLPATLQTQLRGFRRRVWTIKLIEACCGALFGALLAFVLIFLLDRLWDTPATLRWLVLLGAVGGCAVVPWFLHQWVWQHRRMDQLARLLSRKLPNVGDQLLGIIELVRSESEQARSRALCVAAVAQVASDAEKRDLTQAAPDARHRLWGVLAVAAVATTVTLIAMFPDAAWNAWQRYLLPWKSTPRYTFTALENPPQRLIVPHGEAFTFQMQLRSDSAWQPAAGEVQIEGQRPVSTTLHAGAYAFELPPQVVPALMDIRIGDARHQVRVEPTLRPELTSIVAEAKLPDYLGITQPRRKDVRGGSVSLVTGTQVRIEMTASRDLAAATVDQQSQTPRGATFSSPPLMVNGPQTITFGWQDKLGLSGKDAFQLQLAGRDDEAPTVYCENLPRQHVILDSEQLTFKVRAEDDFGIKQVGFEWRGLDHQPGITPAAGERILGAGGNEQSSLELLGTFSAKSLDISPQPVIVRVFAEDYLPGRERVYGPACVLYVLDPEQHAIWITEQLSKWHRQSLEVRDRELQLYETNKQLRELSPDQLNQAATREQIANQASAERANARRLSHLTTTGEQLVQQAARNPEFGVGHLEKWAEMLQILKDISANRMPSVSDLLNEAAKAPQMASSSNKPSPPAAGNVRATGPGGAAEEDPEAKPESPKVPVIADVESSQQKLEPDSSPPSDSNSSPRLTLPSTTLLGGGPKGDEACPAGQKMDQAIEQQRDLLAEFEKIADELNRVLANLEGSTLVKRLKAASRLQYRIAGSIAGELQDTFGESGYRFPEPVQELYKELSNMELDSSRDVSLIMDDMEAYFERRQFVQFKNVLDDMRAEDVVGQLRRLSDEMSSETGLSVAICEYYSDALDRWAEDLVDPASGGT